MHNFYFVCRSIFWKARRIDALFFCFEEEFIGKPGSRVGLFFLNAAINQQNALLLSWPCAGWGFFWKKIFLESRMYAQFLFCL